MKNLFHTIFVASIMLLLNNSCQKTNPCGPQRKDTTFFYFIDRLSIPYSINNYIDFKHSTGEIWTYKVQSMDSGYAITQDRDYECPNLLYTQYLRFNLLKTNTTTTKWDIKILLYYRYGPGASYINIDYLNSQLIFGTDQIPRKPGEGTFNFDSININGFLYRYVSKFKVEEGSVSPFFIYCNYQYGILKIENSPGGDFERIP